MDTSDPKEEEVFKAALELPEGHTRAAFLADACEGDEALRLQISEGFRRWS
jgi:hypothetical protein